ncbi:MAG: DUF167 domain-containing protein [Thermodesulfobacteriota bacterium]
MPLDIKENKIGISFPVRVTPRASATRAEGLSENALKLRLTAPPVENAANRAVLEFFAKTLGIAKSNLSISAGDKSRNKTVLVEVQDSERPGVRAKLRALAGEEA